MEYKLKREPSETKISSPEAIKLYGPHHGWGYTNPASFGSSISRKTTQTKNCMKRAQKNNGYEKVISTENQSGAWQSLRIITAHKT